MNRGVSIIICCYNSALKLPKTLRHIALQKITDNVSWEVIIVDNKSSDNTKETARIEWINLGKPTNLKIVDEPRAGLSFAREKGFSEAQYEYLLLCDDDNLLDRDYLLEAKRLLDLFPQFGIFGGNSRLVSGLCNYITEHHLSNYAVGEQTTEEFEDLTGSRGAVWGAGMVLRKSVYNDLRRVNFKSLLTDRKGKELSSGGDIELCYAARLLNWKIGASRLLNLAHDVSEERLNLVYLLKLKKNFGSNNPFLNTYESAWEYRKDNSSSYSYRNELGNNFRILTRHKKALLILLLGQKKYRNDFIELPYVVAKIKTIIKFRCRLEKEFHEIVSKSCE